MKLPLSWIKEIIELNAEAHQIAKWLTNAGLEVDSFEPLLLNFTKVVVGEVLSVERHPNADKLVVAAVTDGAATYQIVCGAPNCRVGLKTAFALEGATIGNGDEKAFKIKKTKLKGVESSGMLCSEKELGLGDEASGIMEFSERIKVGTDIAKLYGDILFVISLTPNLGHCANVIGVARELYAASGKKIKLPEIHLTEDLAQPIMNSVSLEVMDEEKCPRYACRLIKNVTVGPSPRWIQERLIACDFRPVNNIVDITNYVLLEMGQPLHAFDFQKISKGKVVIRRAHQGETIVTLDGKERALDPDDLLIADEAHPLAIAGVMGGASSEVSENTIDVLLESAYFDPPGIRRTAKRLQLQTEASKRFERGADMEAVVRALDRASMLIQEVSRGTICGGALDLRAKPASDKTVLCRLSRVNALLGTKLSLSEVEAIFHRLEMGYAWDGQDTFTVKPPSYRTDIKEEVDLVEEIARIYGFENIPKPPPRFISSRIPSSEIYLFENEIRRRLTAQGLQEFITCDLIGPTLLGIVEGAEQKREEMVQVLNPVSVEQSILRTSLLPGLLQVLKYNFDRECGNISGFEIGKVHFKKDEQYKEESVAAIILTGIRQPLHWGRDTQEVDFFDLKGILEAILQEVAGRVYSFKNNGIKTFHPGRQASIYAGELEIGSFGEVHPSIQRKLDFAQKILFAEIDLHNLIGLKRKNLLLQEIPIYPSSSRDLTLTVDKEVPMQEIFDIIYSISSRLLERVSLRAVYHSDKLGPDKKNVTFHFVYRDRKNTVAQGSVDAEHARIQSQIEARIRR